MQEFVFDLSEIWTGLNEFRLFIALIASDGIALDGTRDLCFFGWQGGKEFFYSDIHGYTHISYGIM